MATASKKIRVLIVDDSSIMRSLLSNILSADPDIEIVGTAPDPYVAREKLIALRPDIMTLDLEMPRMDGITFLEKIMNHFPMRVVVISSLSQKGSELALKSLELGAIDVVAKPVLDVVTNLNSMKEEIITRIKCAANAKFIPKVPGKIITDAPKTVTGILPISRTTLQVLAIAASTGGTEALKTVLGMLPGDIPGTIIVQHMPPMFTKTFAKNLNSLCKFEVREAVDGDMVTPGLALLAPGNYHMELDRTGAKYFVRLNQNPLLHGVRPAADPLFFSVAKTAGKNAVGVVLTGMGKDGAQGLLAMRKQGTFNIAQDEESCVVFGMPKEAINVGAIDKVLPLTKIAEHILTEFKQREILLNQGKQ